MKYILFFEAEFSSFWDVVSDGMFENNVHYRNVKYMPKRKKKRSAIRSMYSAMHAIKEQKKNCKYMLLNNNKNNAEN